MNDFTTYAIAGAIIVVAVFTLLMMFARLYRRATKEISFVRTGAGGQKVIMNGGSLVVPVLHEIIPVNMNTLRLEVRRANEQALITRDRMRVDVTAEFYVRVKPSADSIANAAQTLGMKTIYPEQLKELVEGKFVDALRAVAAEMAMTELHEKRVDFVQKVQSVVAEDLLKNGLELEAVSLTGLDQTAREHFNPDNAFDAEGLTRLTEEIETRRKTRNDIEQDANVAVAAKNLQAERQQLEIQRDEEYARLEQQREIQIRRAAQAAEIAREEAGKKREAEEAQIIEKQKVDMAGIAAERTVEEERIRKEQLITETDIARTRAVETAEIEQRKTIELAEQDKAIAVAEKSKSQSEAQAEADKARQKSIKEQEGIETVRQTEIAGRAKAVELVKASEQAEREAIQITVAAQAEKSASQDKADAVRIRAEADAEQERIRASGDAEATKLRADADAERYQVDAEGKRSINEASNVLSVEQIAMQVKLELLKQLPNIIRESVKPMEQIDDIKIIQVDGLLNSGSSSVANGEATNSSTGNLADQVVNSALRYRGQAPLVDSLLNEIGLSGSKLNDLTQGLNGDDSKSDT